MSNAGHPLVETVDTSLSGSFGLDETPRPRRRGKGPWNGPECPNQECQGTQTPVTNTGRTDDERLLRKRRCDDCGQVWVTVEQVVMAYDPHGRILGPARFAEVDVEALARRREARRR